MVGGHNRQHDVGERKEKERQQRSIASIETDDLTQDAVEKNERIKTAENQ